MQAQITNLLLFCSLLSRNIFLPSLFKCLFLITNLFCSPIYRKKTQFNQQAVVHIALPCVRQEPKQQRRAWTCAGLGGRGRSDECKHPQPTKHCQLQCVPLVLIVILLQSKTCQISQRQAARRSAKTIDCPVQDATPRQNVSLSALPQSNGPNFMKRLSILKKKKKRKYSTYIYPLKALCINGNIWL